MLWVDALTSTKMTFGVAGRGHHWKLTSFWSMDSFHWKTINESMTQKKLEGHIVWSLRLMFDLNTITMIEKMSFATTGWFGSKIQASRSSCRRIFGSLTHAGCGQESKIHVSLDSWVSPYRSAMYNFEQDAKTSVLQCNFEMIWNRWVVNESHAEVEAEAFLGFSSWGLSWSGSSGLGRHGCLDEEIYIIQMDSFGSRSHITASWDDHE